MTAEEQRAREEFDAFVASITPPDYDPTFDNEAVEDVGHLDGVCVDVLELASHRPQWSSRLATTAAHPCGSMTGIDPNVLLAVAKVETDSVAPARDSLTNWCRTSAPRSTRPRSRPAAPRPSCSACPTAAASATG